MEFCQLSLHSVRYVPAMKKIAEMEPINIQYNNAHYFGTSIKSLCDKKEYNTTSNCIEKCFIKLIVRLEEIFWNSYLKEYFHTHMLYGKYFYIIYIYFQFTVIFNFKYLIYRKKHFYWMSYLWKFSSKLSRLLNIYRHSRVFVLKQECHFFALNIQFWFWQFHRLKKSFQNFHNELHFILFCIFTEFYLRKVTYSLRVFYTWWKKLQL